MSAIDFKGLATAAREAARECIDLARRNDVTNMEYRQGRVLVLACDRDGERIGDPLEYLAVKELNGERLAAIIKAQAPAQWQYIVVQGSVENGDYNEADYWSVADYDIPGDGERHKIEYWERKRIEKAEARMSAQLARNAKSGQEPYKDAYSAFAAWVDA